MAKKRAQPTVIKRESIEPKKGRRGETLAEAMTGHPDPGHRWERPLQAPGRMQVDFEERGLQAPARLPPRTHAERPR